MQVGGIQLYLAGADLHHQSECISYENWFSNKLELQEKVDFEKDLRRLLSKPVLTLLSI